MRLTLFLTSKADSVTLVHMLKVKLSSKRQATFPKRVCDSLGIKPGDDLILDSRMEGNKEVWVMKPVKDTQFPWFGCFKDYAKGKKHDMDSIRAGIVAGRIAERK